MMDAAGLLINSLDRLVVAWAPLFYFRKGAQIAILLLTVAYVTGIVPNVVAVVTTLLEPERQVDPLCL